MKKEIKTTNSVKKLYLLVSILPVNKRDVFMDLTEKFNVNYHISFLGNGSASSEMLALLGLKESRRAVSMGFIREDKVKDCLDAIEDKINQLGIHAIAFALSLDRIMGLKNYLFLADLGGKTWKKN